MGKTVKYFHGAQLEISSVFLSLLIIQFSVFWFFGFLSHPSSSSSDQLWYSFFYLKIQLQVRQMCWGYSFESGSADP